MEEGLNFTRKVRYTEHLGSTMENLLAIDPWKSTNCKGEDCFLCQSQPGKCLNQLITYQIDCLTCLEVGNKLGTMVKLSGQGMIGEKTI